MRIRHLLTAILAASFVAVAPAASATRHDARTGRELDRLLERFLSETPTFPGVSLAVRAPGLDWKGSAGLADVGAGRRLKPDATFRIASVTKTLTAAAVLRLVEKGRIGLDDPVARHLSRASVRQLHEGGYDVDATRVRHLLTHTSGLYDYAMDPAYQARVLLEDPQHRWTRAEQIEWAMTHGQPLSAPGEAFNYSDTGYVLLGEMLERRTGGGLAAAYRTLLRFERLDLDETYLETLESRPAKARRRVHQYYGDIDTYGFDPSFDLYGGGGHVSTVDDLTRFFRGLLGGHVFDRQSTLRAMLGNPAPADIPDLGMGIFWLPIGGEDCWGHAGFWGIAAYHCPRSGVTLAAMVNQGQDFDGPMVELLEEAHRIATDH
jgi:D-alanyl-D-alanine carboxypeptidase